MGKRVRCPYCGEAQSVVPPAATDATENPDQARPRSEATQADRSSRVVLRRLGGLSVAQLMGSRFAALGLIFGTFAGYSISGVREGLMPTLLRLLFAALGGACACALYTALGFLVGAVSAVAYNLAARLVGGIRLELNKPSE